MNNWLDKKKFGVWCEDIAAAWLANKGWHILERNVHFREGEIDMIVELAGSETDSENCNSVALRFVEVKGRQNENFGGVVEALTREKMRRMRKAIWRWRERSGDRRVGEIWFLGICMGRSGEITVEEYFVE